jgi:hypothetical protein
MHVKGQAAAYAGPLPSDVGGKRAIEQITRAIEANERERIKRDRLGESEKEEK